MRPWCSLTHQFHQCNPEIKKKLLLIIIIIIIRSKFHNDGAIQAKFVGNKNKIQFKNKKYKLNNSKILASHFFCHYSQSFSLFFFFAQFTILHLFISFCFSIVEIFKNLSNSFDWKNMKLLPLPVICFFGCHVHFTLSMHFGRYKTILQAC